MSSPTPTESISPEPTKPAWKSVPASRHIVFWAIAVVGCGTDLWTKQVLFDWLGQPGTSPTWWLIDDVFGFRTSLNEGALFGIGQGFTGVFALLSVLAAIFVVLWLFVAGHAVDWLLTVALSCVMAGIFGNLYDRLGMHGLVWNYGNRAGEHIYAVRDWIQMNFGSYEWPTYNIADALLVCGAALLVVHSLRTPPRHVSPEE